jgi:hypothetical protein
MLLLCRLTSDALTIDFSTPTLWRNLNEHPIHHTHISLLTKLSPIKNEEQNHHFQVTNLLNKMKLQFPQVSHNYRAIQKYFYQVGHGSGNECRWAAYLNA